MRNVTVNLIPVVCWNLVRCITYEYFVPLGLLSTSCKTWIDPSELCKVMKRSSVTNN